MNNTFKAHLLMLFTTLVAAFNYSISKEVMPEYMSPYGLIVIRSICAASVFYITDALFIKEKIQKEDYVAIFLCALTGAAINQLFFYRGLSLTSPINATLMMTSIPILVFIISSIIIKEKITFIKILGITLGATGAVLLLLNSDITSSNSSFIGDLFMLLNGVSYAVFLVIIKPLVLKYNAITLMKWIFGLGLIMIMPFGVPDLYDVQWNSIPSIIWIAIIFIIIFPTILNYYFNAAVLKYINPSIVGIYIYLQPPLTAIIAISWGKDNLTLEKVGYSFLILVGVFLVSKK